MWLGDQVIDLSALHAGLVDGLGLSADVLPLRPQPAHEARQADYGRSTRARPSLVRRRLAEFRTDRPSRMCTPAPSACMPVEVTTRTLLQREDHARNVGKMFRDPDNALLPNWGMR